MIEIDYATTETNEKLLEVKKVNALLDIAKYLDEIAGALIQISKEEK